MAELLCCETECDCRAYEDPTLMDDRVLNNLLRLEDRHLPNNSYFECVQTDVTPSMRRTVAEWMLEVCGEQKCQEEVFPLAMIYVDRFLSVCKIKRKQLQLLGSTCLLLSSKLKETRPLTAQNLVFYTDYSVTLDDLWRWELLVLSKLKWDISTVTPHDFVSHIIRRIPLDENTYDRELVLRHVQTFIALCAREHMFTMYAPSIIASASIAATLHGVGWTIKQNITLQELLHRLHQLTGIEAEYLHSCLDQIEDMIKTELPTSVQVDQHTQHPNNHDSNSHESGDYTHLDKLCEYSKAGTPTDVRDVYF